MSERFCIIMAGGVGSRFWPLSKEEKPKQFIDVLGNGKSFIRQTYERMLLLVDAENIFVATNAQYKDLVKEHIPELTDNQIILEPLRRNTAPCIAYATHKLKAINKNAVVMVVPSDHYIANKQQFVSVLKDGCDFAEKNDSLVTIGINPTHPETGYGYIQMTEDNISDTIYKVKTFTEKPNLEMAQVFIESGEFLWNSGMFIWSIKSITKAFMKYQPDIEYAFEQGADLYNTTDEKRFVERVFSECVNVSIDYAIMEKASNVYVIKASFVWSDIGTWESLYDYSPKTGRGNVLSSTEDIYVYDTSDSIISLPKGKVAVIEGLDNFIVAESDNVLMICPRGNERNIKLYSDMHTSKKNRLP
ncbi:MAG: mannose-1-phosphate guanylyltransferase [Rikenellaceae bacterium]